MKNKKRKKGLSGFKKFLLIYIGIFVIAAVVLLILLHGLLKDYEASEPNNVMQSFTEDFSIDTISRLLEESDTGLTEFETIDVLKEYFADKVTGQEISYKRKNGEFTTSRPVYSLMAGDNEIAKVTLAENGKNGYNFTEWKVGTVELADALTDSGKITITAPLDAAVYINGVEVSESYKAGEDTVVAHTKNMEAFGQVKMNRTYEVKGLMKEPEVTAKLGDTELTVSKKDAEYTIGYPADEELLVAIKDRVTQIFECYGRVMIDKDSQAKLLKYTKGTAYELLKDIPALWAYPNSTYEFKNESVSNLIKYSDNCVAVDVHFDLYAYTSSNDMTYPTSMTYIMLKADGEWYLADFIQY